MAKSVRRPQAQKARRQMIVDMDSRGGDGFHRTPKTYNRKPKYGISSLVAEW